MYHAIDDLKKLSKNDLINIILLHKEKIKKRESTIKKMSYLLEDKNAGV